MTTTKILPVLMSGGSGTRLWPLSTTERPKQFHRLGGERTMIEETALRLRGAHDNLVFLDPVIIANAAHVDLITQLMTDCGLKLSALVLEPEGRNTAATAALAAMVAEEIDPDALVLLAPADHLVSRPDAFIAAIEKALVAVSDHVVTFGIRPTGPETGFGYILQGDQILGDVFRVKQFKEKPELSVAMQYLRDGAYSWNSGIFFFAPKLMLEEFSLAGAAIRDGSRKALDLAHRTGSTILLDTHAFAAVPSEAVDRVVMEKTKRAAVALCDIGWADVGSWSELWRLSDKDTKGNVTSGSVTILDGANSLIRAEGVHVSAIGVSDFIIIANEKSVLIMPRSRAQDVKKVIPDKS